MSTPGIRLLFAPVPTATALTAWEWLSYQPAPSAASPAPAPISRVSNENRLTVVTLDDAQKRSGIETDALVAISSRPQSWRRALGLHMGFTQGLLATLVAETAPVQLWGNRLRRVPPDHLPGTTSRELARFGTRLGRMGQF